MLYIELDILPTKMAGAVLSLFESWTLATFDFIVSLSHRQKLVTSSSGSLLFVDYSVVSKPSSFLISSI